MRKVIAAVLGALALAAILFAIFHQSEEDRVRETLTTFVKAVSVKDGDTVLSRAARIRSTLPDTVDDNVHVSIEELGMDVSGRAALTDDATKVGAAYQSASCELATTTMFIDEGSSTAKVNATAIITGVDIASADGRKLDHREVTFLLRKTSGNWRITTIDVARPGH